MDANYGFLRKVHKPAIEKRRRERMNHSLSQLKSLQMDVIKQQNGTVPMLKLEKADILELSVHYISQLRDQQRSISIATNAVGYQAGYQDCTEETMKYMNGNSNLNTSQICCLGNHLQQSFCTHVYQDASVRIETDVSIRHGYDTNLELSTMHTAPNTELRADWSHTNEHVTKKTTSTIRNDVNGNKTTSCGVMWRPW